MFILTSFQDRTQAQGGARSKDLPQLKGHLSQSAEETRNFTPVSTPRPVQSDSQQSELMALRQKKATRLPAIIAQRHTTEKASVEIEDPTNEVANDSEHEHELEEDNEEGGMLAFRRALSLMHDNRARSADEDENEGNAFLGDADERRGGL
ncbi:hypothetical protein BU17DRAFT_68723 [Hysterangium stoloniferum]|nr:hypothetical protein BU17DRAFT_68723 [Hysterangium stoloniferum]